MKANNNQRPRQWFVRGIALAAAALFTACDTPNLQSGIEGTGAPRTTPIAALSRGRIDGIDGLGVAVNGVTWSAASAKTYIDGAAASPVNLKPGMMATVQGERAASDHGTANVIETQIVARGPILELDAAMFRLNVLGQTIVVDRTTNVDVPGASLAALSIGQIATVSGFITADGEVRATLITITPGQPDWIVNGTVTAVATGVRQFAINGLEIVYSVALAAQAIEVGQTVRVSGTVFTADGALIATSVAPYDASLPTIGSETVALSGIITKIEGNSISFWNQRIVLSATISTPLEVGSYVRVTGQMSHGVLLASDVQVLGSGQPYTNLVGYIEALDVAARTLTMFGVQFSVGQTSLRGFHVDLRNLSVGERVHIIAYPNRFISAVQSAYAWPHHAEGLVLIEGEFLELAPPLQFSLRGVTDWVVQVSDSTSYGYHWLGDPDWPNECGSNLVSAERFWELAAQPKPPGLTYVAVWGRFEGGILLARSANICFPAPP